MKSLYESMLDPEIFGNTFGGPSFAAWRTVAKVLDGLPLSDEELRLYQTLTGRTEAPTEPFTEGYLVKPRRAGGTLFGAAVGLHAALNDYRSKLGPGETAVVALVASDRRQAQQLMGYVKGLIADSPLISAEVEASLTESVAFSHKTLIEVHVASFRSTRGFSFACVLLDELAFYRSDTSASPDVELVRAVRPGLVNLGGRLLGFSSPHARRGHLWNMHRDHYGKDEDSILVLQAQDPQILNPTVNKAAVDRAVEEDPEAARSEWFGQFRSDISQFLDEELIEEALCEGRKELPFLINTPYVAFVDPSGGRHDSYTLSIAHPLANGKLVQDRLLIATPPFDPERTTQNFTEVCRSFGIRSVSGDAYAGEWVSAMFRKYGMTYEPATLDKSAIYIECLPLFSQGRVEILDIPQLATQLRLLERRPRAGGKSDAVDHPPRSHDDAANATCGALWMASKKSLRVQHAGNRPRYAIT